MSIKAGKDKKHNKKYQYIKRIITTLILTVVIVYTVYGAYLYNTRVRETLSQTTLTTLSEIASQQQFSMGTSFSANIASIKSVAYTLVVLGYEREDVLEYLGVIESYNSFDNITILGIDKAGIASNGQDVNYSDSEFFDRVLRGNTLISTPQTSYYSGDTVVIIATPIFEYGSIVGAVSAELPLSYLNNLLHPSFDERGYAFIVDDDGTIIARTENDYFISTNNLFDTLRRATYDEGVEVESIIASIVNGSTGNFTFRIDDEIRIIEYRPIPFSGWSAVVALPDEVLNREVTAILYEMNQFNIKLLFGTFISVLFFVFLRTSSVQAIKKAAYYDSLTGIPNLTKFKIDIEAILKKNPNVKFTVVNFDIVNFKAINDFYDFRVGDKVLQAIADTGRSVSDKFFVQGRIGRDDFLLFHTYEFYKNLETIRFDFESYFRTLVPEIENHNISYRYGRYAIEDNNEDVNSIVNKVMLAHSYGKHNSKEVIYDYNDSLKTKLIRTTEISNKQRAALENNEFEMYLQPKCQLKDGSAVGAEALVRWKEKSGNMIFPNDFIPLFESNGFIVELDMYMLERVCQTLTKWKEKGYTVIPISVNFSRKHLELDNFAEKIETVANKYGIEKHLIEIELTEGIFFENESLLKTILSDLHSRGFSLSMDDFGTGYSSLGLLHSLPVDVIKLDRSFFTKTEEAERAVVLVESVVKMSHKLGIPTVAEGVETLAQVELLKRVGCEMAQGYFYSKPLPLVDFEDTWINKSQT